MGGKLRVAGEFKNRTVVEYSTVKVAIPRGYLPTNLLDLRVHGEDDDIVNGLSVSPTGRLTWKPLILDSEALAYAFQEHLHGLFEQRRYAHHYELTVVVQTSTMTVTTTKLKARHSAAVRVTLGLPELSAG